MKKGTKEGRKTAEANKISRHKMIKGGIGGCSFIEAEFGKA